MRQESVHKSDQRHAVNFCALGDNVCLGHCVSASKFIGYFACFLMLQRVVIVNPKKRYLDSVAHPVH